MDPNDRVRGRAAGSSGSRARKTVIRGPNSALTDYLQEIGVTDHFRERRRIEIEQARLRQQQQQQQQEGRNPENAAETQSTNEAEETEVTADAALAADMQEEEEQAQEAGPSTSTRSTTTEAVVEVETVKEKIKVAVKGKKKKKAASDDEYSDEMNHREGLNRSSARKGGRMHNCEMCGKRFLLRGEPSGRLLCAACRRSVEKASADRAAETKRARSLVRQQPNSATKRRKIKKTEGGLLELDAQLPTLQDLCVRAIARHLDQVESFGDIGTQSMNRLNRIISKLRALDEQKLSLFMGPDRTTLTLYDCTRIEARGLQRIASECPRLESLDLQFCGRLNGATLHVLAQGLPQLNRVRLDGAFLVADEEWATFFRTMGERLRALTAAFAGFGPVAMRALVSHCTQLEALRLVECTEFDDDSLGMLAWPITEHEEALQDAERQLRADSNGSVPPWQSLAHLRSLELLRPHKPMTNMTAKRVLREIGSHLRVLDVAGFRDVMDDFADEVATHACGLRELGMASCDAVSAAAMERVFGHMRATQTLKAHHGLTRVDLSRCYMLTDRVVQELVRLAGSSLRHLNLNSVDDNLTEYGLLALAGLMHAEDGTLQEQTLGCTALEELDVSWVRSMTDEVLGQIVPRCKHLARIDVYGCGGVTAFAPARPGLKYVGRECDTL
ncbi:UV-damaged DNA-binding protein rad7 [Coemansia sp. RSA 1821]|nr:hypothetical protein BX667DRAFT_503318 [Coemansia mojavensis]KAJ1741086.1 UV-damaged DNA-binding protein rad7 [Coemansia sp. RSA 1086]KAJ1749340.1 UV-damaged DNA-binding protein rad7 [Coemansia sp. RSA 1821]